MACLMECPWGGHYQIIRSKKVPGGAAVLASAVDVRSSSRNVRRNNEFLSCNARFAWRCI